MKSYCERRLSVRPSPAQLHAPPMTPYRPHPVSVPTVPGQRLHLHQLNQHPLSDTYPQPLPGSLRSPPMKPSPPDSAPDQRVLASQKTVLRAIVAPVSIVLSRISTPNDTYLHQHHRNTHHCGTLQPLPCGVPFAQSSPKIPQEQQRRQ